MKNSANLTRLIYVSCNIVPHESFDQEVDGLLKAARKYNKNNNISGALLFNAGYFAQVLEGPEESVGDLFERIQADERHEDCVVLCCKPTSQRSFSKWSMAYEGRDTVAKSKFAYMIKDSELTGDILSADAVFTLLLNHINQASNADASIS